MITTTKQLHAAFTDIATRHKFINSFVWAKDADIGASSKVSYPALIVSPNDASLIQADEGLFKTIEHTYDIKLVDLVSKDKSNELDVDSDTLQILTEVVNELNNHPYYQGNNLVMLGDIIFDHLFEFSDDETNGWGGELTIKVNNNNQFCGLPFEELSGYTIPTLSGNTWIVETNTDHFTTGATYNNGSISFDRTNDLNAYSVDLSNLSATTLYVQNVQFTIELMDAQTVDFYAPYDMTIESIDTVLSSTTVNILDDDTSYTLGDSISIGSKITVSGASATVINLNATH